MGQKKGNKSNNGNTPIIEFPNFSPDQKSLIGIYGSDENVIEPLSAKWNDAWNEQDFLDKSYTAINDTTYFGTVTRDLITESDIDVQQNWWTEQSQSEVTKASKGETVTSETEQNGSLESVSTEISSENFKETSIDKYFGDLIYPIDAKYKMSQDHVKFEMIEYEPNSASLFKNKNTNQNVSKTIKKIFGSVRLPIPDGIMDSNQVAWNGSTLGPLAVMALKGSGAIANAVGGAVEKGNLNPVFEMFKTGSENVKALLNDPVAGVVLKNKLTSMAVNSLGISISPEEILNRSTGRIINQNMELLFSGQTLRQFSFAFMLLPRSQEESIEVRKIIRFFKQGMAPKKSGLASGSSKLAEITGLEQGSLFLKTPNVFKISYLNGESSKIKGLNKFKTCACQGVSVNYAPNGYSSYMVDSQPVMVTISLNFQEVEPVFYDDYEDSENNFTDDDIGF